MSDLARSSAKQPTRRSDDKEAESATMWTSARGCKPIPLVARVVRNGGACADAGTSDVLVIDGGERDW